MLTPEAERLWEWLQQQPGLSGFILIGGSALSLRINHRFSESLDLTCLAEKLPTKRLKTVHAAAATAGFVLQPDDDEAALVEFSDGGLELHDYQQDFIADHRLRLSFFTADPPLIRALGESETTVGPRLAMLPELFRSKCLVSAKRSKTRDWFDLYILIRDHGFTLPDMAQAFQDAGIPDQMDSALTRLCSGKAPPHDEGLFNLLDNPPNLESIAEFFRTKRDEYETAAAARKRKTDS
jgi:hypothetical protein